MATLCIAALIAIKAQTRVKCYLTLIGGGAFKNKSGWIIDAITKALTKYKDYPIDVMLVHYNKIDPEYSAELKVIEKIITDLPEKCGSSKFDIATFLHPIPDANKTIKEITLPSTTNKMKLYAIQGSLVDFKGDVMVNAADDKCLGGGGIDGVIRDKGGDLLLQARRALPLIKDVKGPTGEAKKDIRCPTGQAKTTIGGNLNTCLCIHAVGPNYTIYNDKWPEADLLLYSAYFNSMKEAYHHGCTNIAFSLLSSSIFRGSGDNDRGLESVICIGILAVVDFAIIFGNVVDVFFYGFTDEEYTSLVTLFSKDQDALIKIENIDKINKDEIIKFKAAQVKTHPKYENLQLAYDALAIKAGLGQGPGPGDAAATQQQVEIFTKFKINLEKYKPPSILDYTKFGQIIVEDRQVIDERTNKTDYVRTKRVEILVDTLKLFETNTPDYYKSAKKNMLNWCKKVSPRNEKGLEVIVEPIDWGEMALKCTKQYGSIFACLNMANSERPGGEYATGPAAQEENMFRRTNCHFSINRDSMLNPNKDKSYYFYNQSYQDLIGAKDGENTYIDVTSPRICIKDKETYNDVNTPEGTEYIGYDLYDPSNIFLFYELRCAAVYIEVGATFQRTEMEKIIHAQFKTLIKNGLRHAILGAFGCGAFHNPPLEVAALYKECLMLYKDHFDVIAFPIYFAGNGRENYASFRKILLNNPTDEQSIQSIFYNGKASGADAGAEAEAEASKSNEVVTPTPTPTPLAAIAADIAAAINTGAKKKKPSVKKGHVKAGTEKAATVLAAKPAKAETDEEKAAKAAKVITGTDEAGKAETDEAGTDEAAKAAKAAKPATDEAATHEVVKSGSQENDLRQAGRKDLAHSGSADNGSVNGTVNSNPSPSFDISPEGSNGQGMLIGFLILCTLGIGVVSFIK
jgi:O-acetyl-ADP-ribose deacetylase (regulator of RNase III)